MSTADPRIGTLLADRYRIDSRLGAGGMGVVYRATRIDAGRTVAIKFLQDGAPEFVARFRREVAAASRLSHPHLVDILDSGVEDDSPYLVMEYVDGVSLRRVTAKGRIPAQRAVALIRQVLAGIRHAHTGGIVHRDLKPDNALLVASQPEQVKILDFGLAKIVRGAGERENLTAYGIIVGTPGYIAPEQARCDPVDRRADLYSVGVMLYEMVVGKKPFIGESEVETVRMHMSTAAVPPRVAAGEDCCSPALEQVILRALEKQPVRRFQSAEEFAAALEKTPDGELQRAEPQGTVAAIRRAREQVRGVRGSSADKRQKVAAPPSKRRLVRWLGAVLSLGLLVAAALALAGNLASSPAASPVVKQTRRVKTRFPINRHGR